MDYRLNNKLAMMLCLVIGVLFVWATTTTGDNLITRINSSVTATMSSQWRNFDAYKAIDGDDTPQPSTCNCCSGTTEGSSPAWFRLDLGNYYLIKTIILTGRNDGAYFQTQNFAIYDKFQNQGYQTVPIYQNNASGRQYNFTMHLSPPVYLRYLQITTKSNAVALTVCEIKLIEASCGVGLFGEQCDKECHCNDRQPCNRTTGICQSTGCLPGWKGGSCNVGCEAGQFGRDCVFPCRCFEHNLCNGTDGSCPGDKCAPGWKENNCSVACNAGTFGQNCTFRCHCDNSSTCNHIMGSCPSWDKCSAGWKGSNCSIDNNLINRIRENVAVTSSPPYQDYTADKAINYTESSKADTCKCCSGASTKNAWWRINLGTTYPIKTIIFIGRSDAHIDQSRGFSVYDNFKDRASNRSLIYQNKATTGYKFVIPFQPPRILQYVEITSPGILTICEIKLIESEHCPPGYFGEHCTEHCHCNDSLPCERSSGICRHPGCFSGWQGVSCNKKCDWGFYGDACASECHCLHNVSCASDSGYCSNNACAPGWQRVPTCNKVCDWGLFGLGCSKQCHCYENASCDNVNGTCSNGACVAGWQGSSCSEVCLAGMFGQHCNSSCHCLHNNSCNHVDGHCSSGLCAPGWREQNCSLACANNTYGHNCNASCHCDSCHHISGSCDTRACYSQWTGINCNVSAEPLTQDESDSSPAVIIGPVVAVVVLVAVAAAVLLFRRHTSNKPDKATTNLSDLHESQATTSLNKTKPSVVEHKNKKPVQASQEATSTPDEHVYYSFCTTTNTIQIQDLWDYLNQKCQDKFVKMHLEFKKLPSGLVHDCLEASRPENARKNRYKGMIAYDHSRVVLHRVEPATTYINACYINGFSRPKKFIAAQGPQGSTVDDFWEMVVQQNASLIVMLTNVIEIGARKCVQYWPSEEDEELQYSDINITTAKISTFPDYIMRELNVSKAGDRPHRITQVHFTAWPDKDVPDAAWHLVNVWRKVNSLNGNKTDPIVVHCSAGVGRSGTYIALDILHEQAKAEGCIQPLHIVTNMRQQRVNMVQTKDQYVFLHEAVGESLHLGVKPIKTRDFEAVYKSLLEKDSSTGEIGLEQQFLFLQQIKPVEEESEYYNVTLKESDEYRPKATSSTAAARPDLCRIQNYTGKETFIVSRAPTNSDDIPQNLLNVILNRNIKTIVNLHTGKGNSDKTGHFTSMNETEESCIELLETKRQKNFLEKTYEIKRHNSPREGRELKQFVFLMWRDGTPVPSDTSTVIELLNAVQRWQPTTDEAQPMLVVCEFGDERSGLVCALLSEFERIRIKEEVNLLESVKTMKQRNPQLIPNYVQYKYCHSAVLDYIRQSDVYMNV